MASNIIKSILLISLYLSLSSCFSDELTTVYRFENRYSDVRQHDEFKEYVLNLSSKGFNGVKTIIKSKSNDNENIKYNIVNNYDPLVGIALESLFLIELYKITESFVMQNEKDRVRGEVIRRINELHSGW